MENHINRKRACTFFDSPAPNFSRDEPIYELHPLPKEFPLHTPPHTKTTTTPDDDKTTTFPCASSQRARAPECWCFGGRTTVENILRHYLSSSSIFLCTYDRVNMGVMLYTKHKSLADKTQERPAQPSQQQHLSILRSAAGHRCQLRSFHATLHLKWKQERLVSV